MGGKNFPDGELVFKTGIAFNLSFNVKVFFAKACLGQGFLQVPSNYKELLRCLTRDALLGHRSDALATSRFLFSRHSRKSTLNQAECAGYLSHLSLFISSYVIVLSRLCCSSARVSDRCEKVGWAPIVRTRSPLL